MGKMRWGKEVAASQCKGANDNRTDACSHDFIYTVHDFIYTVHDFICSIHQIHRTAALRIMVIWSTR